MSLLIKNGRIITASDDTHADLFVEDERVTLIGERLQMTADRVLDASGRLVLPGGVDPHVHLDLPVGALNSSDDFLTGTRAAAFGGTTTVIDFATQSRGRSMFEGLDEWRRKAEGKACIDYGFHMAVTDLSGGREAEMTRLADEGITSYKLFMAYPDRMYVDDGTLYRAFRRAGEDGCSVMMHAENGIVIDEIVKTARAAGHLEPRYHALTRPARMEAEGVHRSVAIAEVAGVPLYVVHVSCAEAVEELRRGRARGLPVHGETCPQYLFLDSSRYELPGFEAAKYVMTPCLRSPVDQAALWQGLRMGELEAVGTDHCPFLFQGQKEQGRDDFAKIPNGAPGIENRMSLIYHGGVVGKRFGLNRFVQLTSTNAAKIFGLFPRKGTLAVGSDADLVIFDPERVEKLGVGNALTHHMRVDYNAYEGLEVQGYPEVVVSRGRVVCEQGRWLGSPGHGRFIKRGRYGGS